MVRIIFFIVLIAVPLIFLFLWYLSDKQTLKENKMICLQYEYTNKITFSNPLSDVEEIHILTSEDKNFEALLNYLKRHRETYLEDYFPFPTTIYDKTEVQIFHDDKLIDELNISYDRLLKIYFNGSEDISNNS